MFNKEPEYYLVIWSKKNWKDLAQKGIDPEFPDKTVFTPPKILVRHPEMMLGIYIYDQCKKSDNQPLEKQHMVGHVSVTANELMNTEHWSRPLERISRKKSSQDKEVTITIACKVVPVCKAIPE